METMRIYKVLIRCTEICNKWEDEIEVLASSEEEAEQGAWDYIFDMYINDHLPEDEDEAASMSERLSENYYAEVIQ